MPRALSMPPALPTAVAFAALVGFAFTGPDAARAQQAPAAGSPAAAPAPHRGRGEPGLVGVIDPLVADKALVGAQISLVVERVSGGSPLYALNPGLRLHPASNTKIITTAAALEILGPAYRWRTDLAVTGYADGVAEAAYLIGRGDPRFVSESLWKLVDDARVAGLKRVKGDLVVDDTWFTADRMAPGFDDKDQDAAYRAASGAMSLNFNSVSISIAPGAEVGQPPVVSIRPDSGHIEVEVTATTTERGRERLKVHAKAWKGRTKVTVGGRMPRKHRGLTVRRRIDNPPLYAGHAAKLFLERAGITVEGEVRVGPAPKERRRLARLYSPNLAAAVIDVNKLSNNFMAETLVRTLGKEKGKAGDWTAGGQVVRGWLDKAVGLRPGYRYVNGSGLFGQTGFSGRDMVSVLRHMRRRPLPMPEFEASLAIAGVDGTLRRRMRPIDDGRIRAKTGTLDGVICISGYVTFADGTPGVFSFLANDMPGKAWQVWRVQDKVLSALAEYDPPRR